MKPVIGIVGRPAVDECGKTVIGIMDTYRNAIIKSGGTPLLILPVQAIAYWNTKNKDIPPLTIEEKKMLEKQIDLCDGILIGGGERILPYQLYIYEYATKKDKPLLAICLGMQLFGYYQDCNNLKRNETELCHRNLNERYLHEVMLKKGSLLYTIFGKEKIKVNSFHNYHIEAIKGYNVVGISFDGLIEAVEHPNKKFNVGVQWHPEVMMEYDKGNKKLLEFFINECKTKVFIK